MFASYHGCLPCARNGVVNSVHAAHAILREEAGDEERMRGVIRGNASATQLQSLSVTNDLDKQCCPAELQTSLVE